MPIQRRVVGVAGGSAAGKSAVVSELARRLRPDSLAIVPHDAYYHDLAGLEPDRRFAVNVDHPDSLDTARLVRDVRALRSGRPVEVPVYDFASRTRLSHVVRVEPRPIIVVEGILVLADTGLRALMDLKVFVATSEEERLARRLERDVEARGSTYEAVRAEHTRSVQPMHVRFVEPSRIHADVTITGGARNSRAVGELAERLERWLYADPAD